MRTLTLLVLSCHGSFVAMLLRFRQSDNRSVCGGGGDPNLVFYLDYILTDKRNATTKIKIVLFKQ